MENNKITKIQKAASTTAKVLNVFRVILIVALVITLVSGIMLITRLAYFDRTLVIFGKTVRVLGPFVGLEEGIEAARFYGFDFINDLHIDNLMIHSSLNCFVAAAIVAVALVCVIFIKKAFMVIAESETPFNTEVLKYVKIVGILVTVLVLTESVGIAAIVALTFWCIYCVFDYGIELQKSADETL
ncbi:MAG: hypothetical protein K5796_00855 [Lachnospiraceae bacterium]|nr:hypothetical protein [Lachnospiraceae bacterium]